MGARIRGMSLLIEGKNKYSGEEAQWQRKRRLQERATRSENSASTDQAGAQEIPAANEERAIDIVGTLATENAALRQENAGLRSEAENALRRLQALQMQIDAESGVRLVDEALRDAKLLPAQREWAIHLGRVDLPALRGFLRDSTPIPGLGRRQ